MKITPEEQVKIDEAKLIAENANPETAGANEDNDKGVDENYEKRFKDTQASFTKAQQEKVEMAKMLVEADPSNVERIPDEKVKIKVLQEKWGVDTIEELNIMFPDYKKTNSDEDEDDMTEVEKLKQKVSLMEYQGAKTKTNEEIGMLIESNKDLVAIIPNFESELREQMKNISSTVTPKDRVNMAFKLVVGSKASSASAYGAMQGVTGFSAGKSVEPEKKNLNSTLVSDIMGRRRM